MISQAEQARRGRSLDSDKMTELRQVAEQAAQLIRQINRPAEPKPARPAPSQPALQDQVAAAPQPVASPAPPQTDLPETEFFGFLTARQVNILLYLIENRNQITKYDLITAATGYSYNSVRDALYDLEREGFVTGKTRFRRGNFRGLKYTLDEERCAQFLQWQARQPDKADRAAVLLALLSKRLQARQQSEPHSKPHSKQQSESHSEKQLKILNFIEQQQQQIEQQQVEAPVEPEAKPNPLQNPLDTIAQTLATHPELGYWRQKGLTARQIERWMQLTGASLESMVQSLCHCRFEMVDLGKEESKPVDNVFNWFFRIIERLGYYPRPQGYKSFAEKQLEITKKIVAEKQQQAKALAELQQQKIAAEREIAFHEMLADPNGELYQECYGRINNYAKQTKLVSIFTRAMREAFDEIMNEREIKLLEEAKAQERAAKTKKQFKG